MALDVERVLDGGVDRQESLGSSGRFETLHLPLASSSRLMRILSPIVLPQPLLVPSRQSHCGLCRAVRAKLVGDQNIRREALFLKQLAHEFHGCSLVASPLHKEVEGPRLRRQPRAGARTAGPRLLRPSHRDAIAMLAADACGEAHERTPARISIPIAAPFRRTHPVLSLIHI